MPKINNKQIKEITSTIMEKLSEMEGFKANKKEVKDLISNTITSVISAEKSDSGVKKAKSAYIFFSTEMQKDPKIAAMSSVADRARAIGAMWKELKDKSKYEKLAAKDKERAEKEKASA